MAKIRAKGDAQGAERRFLRETSRLERELRDTVREVAEESELIYSAFALRKTGRMSRGVKAHPAGMTATVTVHAREPKTGFDYVAVTRFGHLKARIYPTHAAKAARFTPKKAKAFPLPGIGFRASIRGFAALNTPFGFRRSVRGFRPSSDWAERALPEVEANASEKMTAVGLRVVTRLAS